MPFASLDYTPGINTQLSLPANPNGFSIANLIRWMWGKPQKLGGWTRLTSTPLVGTCRGMHAWSDLAANGYLGCGTEQRLQVFTQGEILDITPLRATDNVTPNFSTVLGSPTVTVIDANHGAATGDWLNILVPVSVGGLIIQGFYLLSVIDTNTYTITAASNATATASNTGAVPVFNSTNGSPNIQVTLDNHGLTATSLFTVQISTTIAGITMLGTYPVSSVVDANNFVIAPGSNANATTTVSENGGNASLEYLLPSGVAVNTILTGYGIGDYGAGDYGIGSSGSITEYLRQWFLDNWGQLLIGNPSGGSIYVWDPTTGQTPASLVATAPTQNAVSFVIAQAQILVCLGAESGGTQFPNLVRWSNVSDYTDFTPTASNQAGSFEIPTGSKLVGGLVVGLGALLWTDTDLWTMTYQGLPFVFDFQKVSSNCEMISARSAGVIGTRVIWPSLRGFFQFDGGTVTPLACSVWDYFFANIDLTQAEQVFCATNSLFNEMAWYFPLPNGTVNYVKFNILENSWDTGTLTRTAWTDHSVIGNPIGSDAASLLQQHETSNDADGLPMMPSITSGFAAIGNSEDFWFVDAVWPDIVTDSTNPQMTLTLFSANSPGDTPVSYGPFPFNSSTEFIPVRVRGRLLGYTIASSDLGTFWRVGRFRVRWSSAGRR